MNQEKRLIAIFRSFVEKSLLPQIKKVEGSTQEWQRFNSLLSADTPNLSEMQIYVDTLPSTAPTFDRRELTYSGRKKDDDLETFQANRTFGP